MFQSEFYVNYLTFWTLYKSKFRNANFNPQTIFFIRVDEWLSNIISTAVVKNILPSYCIWLYRVLARAPVEHQNNMEILLVRHIRYVEMQSALTERMCDSILHVDNKLSVLKL